MIREKKGGTDGREDNGPSEVLDVGGERGGRELESHNEEKEAMKMTTAAFKKKEDEPSVSLLCSPAC